MDSIFAAGTALAVSLFLIPLLVRLAPQLGLLDEPNSRKVHKSPVPRVGGWGIAGGALVAVLLWQPMEPLALGFLFGGLVLLVAGASDDIHDLRGRTKLMLQVLAVVPVVIYSGLVLESVPLLGALPFWFSALLSILGLIVCINGINTSDGLDGLAAGVAMLSLLGILYIAFTGGVRDIVLMTAAAIGGLLGFLRYNTHPAILFMGDLGSQFLGFVVGMFALALALYLPDSVSPWSLLLLIGLPTADIVVVALRRLKAGVPLMTPDNRHIHHRFLALGFSHYQSVIAIYTLQGSFVLFGVTMRTFGPGEILLVYALHLAAIYGFLSVAEARRSESRSHDRDAKAGNKPSSPPRQALLWVPRVLLETVLPLALVTTALIAARIPVDFGILGAILFVGMLLRLAVKGLQGPMATRIPVYLVATSVLYVYCSHRPFEGSLSRALELAFIGAIVLMAVVAVKFSPKRRKEEFRWNALDYLLVLFAILAVVAFQTTPSAFNPYFLLYLPAVLYSVELLLVERRRRTDWLPPAALAAAAILAVRGLWLGG